MVSTAIAISLISPTYNEAPNIEALTKEIFGAVESHPYIDLELIVVDDNSPDGTADKAESLKETYPIQVLRRPRKEGLGSAVMDGFALSKREYLGVIDADLSHDPRILPQLISALHDHDIATGSRYSIGSRVEHWPWYRKIVSEIGVKFAKRLTGVKDPLSGYFVLRRDVLGDLKLTSPGYKILLEILVKGKYKNIKEIPFVFRNRKYSKSKLNFKEYYLFSKQLLFFSLKKKSRRQISE